MGCFTYSAEEDTPAAEYDNQIDEEVKKRRADVLMDIQYSISEQRNKARVGNTYKVIVDSLTTVCITAELILILPRLTAE